MRAPELQGAGGWLNTGGRELTLAGLRGRIVLLDFWTSACANCLHVIDELRPLEARYADVLTRIVSESDRRPVRMSGRAIAALSSFPIATQRIVRVWARRRWRSGKAAVDRHH